MSHQLYTVIHTFRCLFKKVIISSLRTVRNIYTLGNYRYIKNSVWGQFLPVFIQVVSPLYPGYSSTVYFAPGPICLTLQDGYIPFLVSESSGGGGDADKITLTMQKLEDFPTD